MSKKINSIELERTWPNQGRPVPKVGTLLRVVSVKKGRDYADGSFTRDSCCVVRVKEAK